jgi:glucan biosynthesis protein C
MKTLSIHREPRGPVQRLAYIDNIRWTMIALVVLMHACVTYSGMGSWFYVEKLAQDIASTLLFSLYQTFAQAFFMGLLFFLAGTLVPGAYDRKGFVRFLADRAVRLGVPSLVFMLVLDPLTNAIREIATGVGFSWAAFLPGYRDFVLSGRFLSASGPLWFAVALLVFSLVYAVARLVADLVRGRASRRLSTDAPAARSPSPRAVSIAAACLVALITLAAFLVRLVQPLGTSVMNMQLGYFASYIVLFVVGLRAGRTGLLQAIPAKEGRAWLWLSIGIGLPAWVLLLALGGALSGKQDLFMGGWHWQAAGFAAWESFFCVAFSLGLLTLYRERMNVKNRVTGLLSYTGFGAYTFHAPILVGVSMLLITVSMHPLAKALVAAGLAWAASIAFAWVVRKIPVVGRLFA